MHHQDPLLKKWRAIHCARRSLQRLAHERPAAIQTALVDLLGGLRRLDRLNRQITLARQHGLHAAAGVLCRRAEAGLSDLENTLRVSRACSPDQSTPVPSPDHFAGELEQLDEEFGGYEFADGVLSVSTRPVTLGDPSVYLGPFRLELDVDRLDDVARGIPLRAEALQPNPAVGQPHITHPHISNDRVCLGDAISPIQHALTQGRLADALLLVNSVLHHYNSDSPYVELEHWDGAACFDCGDSIDRDDSFYCEPCGHEFCSDCTSICERCDDSYCLSCLGRCSACEESTCAGCSSLCGSCGEQTCLSCLDNDLCPGCIADEQEDEEELTDPQQPQPKEPSHEPTSAPPPYHSNPHTPHPAHPPPVEAA